LEPAVSSKQTAKRKENLFKFKIKFYIAYFDQ